jgi:hypothetical protein
MMRGAGAIRSLCFLFGIMLGWNHQASAEVVNAADAERWQFERYTDPMHRGGAILAARAASTDKQLTVLIRCWSASGELDLRFLRGDARPFASTEITWQFDRARPQTGRWLLSQAGTAIVVPETLKAALLESMRKGNKMVFSLPGDGAFTFSLRGSAQAIGAVTTVCR